MKISLILSLLVLSQSRLMFSGSWKGFSKSSEPSKLDVISGLLAGMALESPSLALSPCLEDLEKISTELLTIVSSIEHPSFTSIFKVLRQIELALRDLPRTIQECMKELKPNTVRLSAALETIRSPKSAVYQEHSSLKINGVEVFQDIAKIQENLIQQKWFDAGFVIGNVLAKLSSVSLEN